MATIEQVGPDLKVTHNGKAYRVKGATMAQAQQWLASKGIPVQSPTARPASTRIPNYHRRPLMAPQWRRLIQRAPSPLAPGIGGSMDQSDEMLTTGP